MFVSLAFVHRYSVSRLPQFSSEKQRVAHATHLATLLACVPCMLLTCRLRCWATWWAPVHFWRHMREAKRGNHGLLFFRQRLVVHPRRRCGFSHCVSVGTEAGTSEERPLQEKRPPPESEPPDRHGSENLSGQHILRHEKRPQFKASKNVSTEEEEHRAWPFELYPPANHYAPELWGRHGRGGLAKQGTSSTYLLNLLKLLPAGCAVKCLSDKL